METHFAGLSIGKEANPKFLAAAVLAIGAETVSCRARNQLRGSIATRGKRATNQASDRLKKTATLGGGNE